MSEKEKQGPQRVSYRRETKLEVIEFCHKVGGNKYKTARHFKLSEQTVRRWMRQETALLVTLI